MDTDTGALAADTPTVDTETIPLDPTALSSLGILSWDGEAFAYGDNVHSYTLATPLFSDFAAKERAIALPEGTSATYVDNAVLDFPVGTRIVKSFLFPADLRAPTENLRVVETRLLVLEEDGWDNWPYVWNEEQTDAFRTPAGAVQSITVTGFDGKPLTFSYLVPSRNQCVDCHEKRVDGERTNTPIGPWVRNLNVGDQMRRLSEAGAITGLPALDTLPAAVDEATVLGVDLAALDDDTLFAAARDYLHVNCAHCHNDGATEGVSSQLFLNWDAQDEFHLGVCKKPGSAGGGTGGLTYDIVPGYPEQSIMWYRMQTEEVGEMMPDIGRSLVHGHGVDLIAEWIRRLEGECPEDVE